VLCKHHKPPRVVDRVTGAPLTEGIMKDPPKAMCLDCSLRINGIANTARTATKKEFGELVRHKYNLLDKSKPLPPGTIVPVRSFKGAEV
jgi:hypothetical protein